MTPEEWSEKMDAALALMKLATACNIYGSDSDIVCTWCPKKVKACTGCGPAMKPISDFYYTGTRLKNGERRRMGKCRNCMKAYKAKKRVERKAREQAEWRAKRRVLIAEVVAERPRCRSGF